MEEYRNNSEERKKSEDIYKKKSSDSKSNFFIDYKNSKHEFTFLKENENKKREIDEDNFYVEKKMKDNKMTDTINNKEKNESFNDFDNIDVSEYKNIISNSFSSDECDDHLDDISQDGDLFESYSKNKSNIFHVHSNNAKDIFDMNSQNIYINNKENSETHNLSNEKKKNNQCENIKIFEKDEKMKIDDVNNENNKINLNTYIYVRLKTNDSTNNIYKCRIDKNITVKKLKKCLKKMLNNENEYRIIYRGRLLKDMENLSKYNIKFNDIIYVIKLNKKKNGNDVALDSGITSSQLSTIKDEYNDLGKFSDNDNISKLISYMFDHSDFIKSIMDSNKQLQKLREKNPDLNHMLNDSQALKQSFEMIKNPSLMKELMRNTDRAISNIEAIPGGFNTLRRMYHNIQEPMYSSSDRSNEKKMNKVKHYDLNSSSPPTSEAFPNPWASKEKISKNQNNYNNLEKCFLMNNNPFNNSNDMLKINNKNNEYNLNNNIFKNNIMDILQKYQDSPNKSNKIIYDKKNNLKNNKVENNKNIPNNKNYQNNLNLFNNALFNNNLINNLMEQNKKNENVNTNKPNDSKQQTTNATNLLNQIILNLNKNLNINNSRFNMNSYNNVNNLNIFNSPNNNANSIFANISNNKNDIINENDNNGDNKNDNKIDNTTFTNNNNDSGENVATLDQKILYDSMNFSTDDNNIHNQNIMPFMNKIHNKDDKNKGKKNFGNYEDILNENVNVNNVNESINTTNENYKNEKSVNENKSDLKTNDMNNENSKDEISKNSNLIESKDNEGNKNLCDLSLVNQMNNIDLKDIAETIKLLRYGNNNMNEQNIYKLYSEELNSLKLMGFTDTQKCIKALVDTKGNIERAIDLLLDDINTNKN
ncbi:ubiquitin-like protein, putative [Plasmodium relictum]|uniref:Ubiquitin-like protein, putative n=1 Tax=Plasmodium relictum TaxID=85471 RepID=A0A1J1H5K2_PLARL|nr:ubiquitin-like protein, putative [Plasmodium relictum]CRH00191.1 ubiquitin-like protein, putative [Plasmodium relictum]